MTIASDNKLQEQVLGLSDSHIRYFAQNAQYPDRKVGIHVQAYPAFQTLVTKGANLGLTIEIASGFRSFERQLMIWNNKFTGKTAIKDYQGNIVPIDDLSPLEIINAILLFSALPGTSRHHWGCDIDVYAPNLLASNTKLQLEPWEYSSTGPMAKLSSFLNEQAQELDFYFPFKGYNGGVAEEPWHLSYLPLANEYQQAIDIKALKQCLAQVDIAGKDTILENLPALVERFVIQSTV